MILKGKYWLNVDSLVQYDGDAYLNLSNISYRILDNNNEHTFNQLLLSKYVSQIIVEYISFHEDSGDYLSLEVCRYPAQDSTPVYPQWLARLVDFGETEQYVDLPEEDEALFNSIFYVLPEGQFVNTQNIAHIGNSVLDMIWSEAKSKFESCKPQMIQLLNSSAGATKVNGDFSNIDITFLRASSYASYTPLCYAIPTKAICNVTGENTFKFQVADNAKYTRFLGAKSSITRESNSGSGELHQVYGLKIPEAQ